MTWISDIYKEIFELNNLLRILRNKLANSTDDDQRRALAEQETVWDVKINELKSKLFKKQESTG